MSYINRNTPGYGQRRAEHDHKYQRVEADWSRCTYCAAEATEQDHVPPLIVAHLIDRGRLVPTCKTCNHALRGCSSANLRVRMVYAWKFLALTRWWAWHDNTRHNRPEPTWAPRRDKDIQRLADRCNRLAALMADKRQDLAAIFETAERMSTEERFRFATIAALKEAAAEKNATVNWAPLHDAWKRDREKDALQSLPPGGVTWTD